MIRHAIRDLDYLAATLHGRRGRLAEGTRLDSLLSLKTLPELARSLAIPQGNLTATDFQQHLVHQLATEIPLLCRHLSGPESDWVFWAGMQFHLANLKLLIRAILSNQPPETALACWLELPGGLNRDTAKTLAASSLATLVARFEAHPLGPILKETVDSYPDPSAPFLLEAALDCGYFREWLKRTAALSGADHNSIRRLVIHEVDTFHHLLILRGRHHYHLSPAALAPFHVNGTDLPHERYLALLNAPDSRPDGSSLEKQAWSRYLRLAHRTFRASHTGFGVVAGYIGLRRMEVANLISVSEGIRAGIPRDEVRPHMLPIVNPEPSHV